MTRFKQYITGFKGNEFRDYIDNIILNDISEVKNMSNTMIGFGIPKANLKKLSSYIKSWLIRYEIDYEEVKEPHFTIAQITGKYEKDELIREIHKIDKNMTFKPKGIKIFRGKTITKDFIVLEYKPNNEFVKIFKDLQSKYEVKYFGSIKPHTSLFIIEPNVMTDELFSDLEYSLPRIPSLRPINKELFNKKFEVEFKER